MTARRAAIRRISPLTTGAPGRFPLPEGRGHLERGGLVNSRLEPEHESALLPDEGVAGEPQRVLDEALAAGGRVEHLVRLAFHPRASASVHRQELQLRALGDDLAEDRW